MGSYVFVYCSGLRYGQLCVCVLLRFKIRVAMYLCTATLQDVGSYVFVYCPGSICG